ncbi:MAG: hypothetical protein R3C14_35195 [Caldilineaceae bacterium]
MTLEALTIEPRSTNGAAHETPVEQLLPAVTGSPHSIQSRRNHRQECADFWLNYPLAAQQPNGDESTYADRRGNFSKCLPHNERGLVDPAAYLRLFQAVTSGDPVDFSAIPIGMSAPPPFTAQSQTRLLTNPQAGYALEMIGPDPEHLAMIPAPNFNSLTHVAEGAEIYWMALARDVHFADYATNPVVAAAVTDFEHPLTGGGKLREALYPRDSVAANSALTPAALFRGVFTGEQMGPYLSQFLLQDCFIGSQQIDQHMYTVAPGINYMTDFGKWLAVQRGLQ